MAEAIVSVVIEHAAGLINVQLGYIFFCKRNVSKLSEAVVKLRDKKYELQALAEDEQRQEREVLPGVSRWLETADALLEQVGGFLETRSTDLRLVNLNSRYKTGKKAAKMTGEVVKLFEEGNLITSAPVLSRRRTAFSSMPSRTRVIAEAIGALGDDGTTRVLGISGDAGVGKTTVAKQIVDDVTERKMFDHVAMAVVSREPDARKIQEEIGNAIMSKLRDRTGIAGAVTELQERVTGRSSSVLVVLDDVWDGFDLDLVGLPPPGSRDGYKILLTSRSPGVSRALGGTLDLILQPLTQEESLDLFWSKVGSARAGTIENLEKLFIQEQILAECKGLPRSLVLTAAQFARGEKLPWDGSLQQLSKLKSSYADLRGEKEKMLFLLCFMFQPDLDIPIESLLRFGMSPEVFDINSDSFFREARDIGHSLVDILKSSSLLSAGGKKETVRINFPHELAMRVVSERDEFGLISTVKWYQQSPSSSSFEGLEKPKFLDMSLVSGTIIESLPGIVRFNDSLETLSMSHCKLQGKDLSCIAGMDQLRILSFAHSDIAELTALPSALRLLDLTGCRHLETISPGVLEGLPGLEELYTLGSAVQNLEEVATRCPRLTSITVHVPSAEHLPRGLLRGGNLTRFQVFVGDFSCPWDEHLHRITNRLSICLQKANADTPEAAVITSGEIEPVEPDHSSELMQLLQERELGSISLFQNLNSLEFFGCDGLVCLFSAAAAVNLVRLHTLKVMNCKTAEEVIGNVAEKGGHVKFPELRILVLKNLPKLKRFCASDEGCAFDWPMLETVRVKALPMMKTFASGSHVAPRLRAVHVTFLDKCWKNDLNDTFAHIQSHFHQQNGKGFVHTQAQ